VNDFLDAADVADKKISSAKMKQVNKGRGRRWSTG
jgi:hypothetical protein